MLIDEVLGEGKEQGEEADAVSDLGRQDIVQDDSTTDMVEEEEVWDSNSIENNDTTIFAADPLMSKVTPETVQGQVHIPQSTAVVSSTSDDEVRVRRGSGRSTTHHRCYRHA